MKSMNILIILILTISSVMASEIVNYSYSNNLRNENVGLHLTTTATTNFIASYPTYNTSGNGAPYAYDTQSTAGNVPYNQTLSGDLTLADSTFRMWFKADVDSVGSDEYLFRIYADGNNFLSVRRESSNQNLYATVRVGGSFSMDTPFYDLSTDQEWHHLVVSMNSSVADSCKVYLDAELLLTDSTCNTLSDFSSVAIITGAYSSNALLFSGAFDEILIDSVVWTQLNVTQDYNYGTPIGGAPPSPPSTSSNLIVLPYYVSEGTGSGLNRDIISYWNFTDNTDYFGVNDWIFNNTEPNSTDCVSGSCQHLDKEGRIGGYFDTVNYNTPLYAEMTLGLYFDPVTTSCIGDNEYLWGINSLVGNDYYYGKRGCQETEYQRDKFNQKYKNTGVTISNEYAPLDGGFGLYISTWYANNTCRTYINGTKVIDDDTCAGWDDFDASPRVMFGGYLFDSLSYGLDGNIDEGFLMQRAMTDTEITEIYNSGIGNFTWYKEPFSLGLNHSVNLTSDGGQLCGWNGTAHIDCGGTTDTTPSFDFVTAGTANCSLSTLPLPYSSVNTSVGWNCSTTGTVSHSCTTGELSTGINTLYISCESGSEEMTLFNTTNIFNVSIIQTITLTGAGTKSDPYILQDCNALRNISTTNATAYYRLNNDISCKGYSFTDSLGQFGGWLDGNNKTISDFYLNKTPLVTKAECGLFSGLIPNPHEGYVYIHDLTLNNFTVDCYAGGANGEDVAFFAGYHSGNYKFERTAIKDSYINGLGYLATYVGRGDTTHFQNMSDNYVLGVVVESGDTFGYSSAVKTSLISDFYYSNLSNNYVVGELISPYQSGSCYSGASKTGNAPTTGAIYNNETCNATRFYTDYVGVGYTTVRMQDLTDVMWSGYSPSTWHFRTADYPELLWEHERRPRPVIISPLNATVSSENVTVRYVFHDTDNLTALCTLYINDTLNSTMTATEGANESFQLYNLVDADYLLRVTCADDVQSWNSSISTMSIDTDAPSISMIFPQPDNSTVTGYIFTLNITVDEADAYVVQLLHPNSTVLFTDLTYPTTDTLDVTGLGIGNYEVTVFANDSLSLVSRLDAMFYVNDTSSPVCTGLGDTTVMYNHDYTWSVSCSDERLFDSFNISCVGNTSFSSVSTGINSTSYVFSDTLSSVTTPYLCSYVYCDGINCVTGSQSINVSDAPSSSALMVNQCPDTIAGMMALWLVVGIALVFVIVGLQYSGMGIFGSIMMIISSLYVVGCLPLAGYVLAGCGLVMIIWFALRNPSQ